MFIQIIVCILSYYAIINFFLNSIKRYNICDLFFRKNQMESTKDIETYPGFCTKCGSILPPLSMEEFLKCYSCKTVFGPESKFQ